MCTQLEIAQETGLDVSSVNKILNKVEGPVFRPETIRLVFRVAKKRHYDFNKASKARLMTLVKELFPPELSIEETSIIRGLPTEKVQEVRTMLYGERVA